jgi:hypothetical protein
LKDKGRRDYTLNSTTRGPTNGVQFSHPQNYRISREALLGIINSKATSKDRVEAAKALVMLDLAVFKAELETGMFKKPVEELVREIHYDPLPDDVRMVTIAAWSRGGLLPAAAVEEMVPRGSAI